MYGHAYPPSQKASFSPLEPIPVSRSQVGVLASNLDGPRLLARALCSRARICVLCKMGRPRPMPNRLHCVVEGRSAARAVGTRGGRTHGGYILGSFDSLMLSSGLVVVSGS